jgi:ubiquinol-cytochrome c reductase cytochrome c subunit
MPKVYRLLLTLLALGPMLLLAGCPGEYGGGYEKVPNRERTPLATVAAPDPPPVIAGFGSPGSAALPTLAAGTAPPGVTQEMVEEGQRLYGTVCTACHGAGGVGTPAGPPVNDQDWIHIDGSFDQLVAIIVSGVSSPAQYPGMMPPLGGGNFTPEQVNAIAAYLLALSQQPGA